MTKVGILNFITTTQAIGCRFGWVVGHEGYLQELKLRALNSKRGYVMKVQKVVG
jgi:hypothetical protein